MKIAMLLIGLMIGLFLLFQIYIYMLTGKSETQLYQVIRADKDYEIRFYPGTTMATISSNTNNYKELGNYGFGMLAGYIFGGNKDKKQIAMTSPVHMNINDTASTMSFVMPSNYNKSNLPEPNNGYIKIHETTDEYVAAIRFGGFASEKRIKEYTEKLDQALKSNSISFYGNFRFLGYNPPYQIFGRRNEIIVSVNKNGE